MRTDNAPQPLPSQAPNHPRPYSTRESHSLSAEPTKFATRLYGRTSKDDPRTVTIDIQKKTLATWTQHDTLIENIAAEYWDEGVSGKIPLWDRPAGKQLLADVRAGLAHGIPQCIAVVYADRFGRTLLDGQLAVKLLEDMGAKLVAVNDGWDSRRNDSPLYFQFRMMLAEEDHRRICQRMQSGKLRAIARDNAPPGGPLTFGYQMGRNGEYVFDPVEAPIVVRIFEMYLQGHSQNSILTWLKTTNVPPGLKYQKRAEGSAIHVSKAHANAQWHLSKITRVLHNPVYLGIRTWADRKFPCPPLIDQSSFDRVQRMIAGPPRYVKKNDGSTGLLSGAITCQCGARYYYRTRMEQSKKKGTGYAYYQCDNHRKHPRTCNTKLLPVTQLDADVWALVESYLQDPEAIVRKVIDNNQELGGHVADLDAQERLYAAQLAAIDNNVNDLWTQQKAGNWPLAWITPQLNELSAARTSINDKLASCHASKAALAITREQSENVAAALASIRAKLAAGLTAQDRIEICQTLIAAITVRTIGTARNKTAEITIELKWHESVQNMFPKLPNDW